MLDRSSLQVELTLVINKVDRLILELRLTPEQAYERMKAIITQVNMIVSAFQSEKYISEADVVLSMQDSTAQANARFGFVFVTWHPSCALHQLCSLYPLKLTIWCICQ